MFQCRGAGAVDDLQPVQFRRDGLEGCNEITVIRRGVKSLRMISEPMSFIAGHLQVKPDQDNAPYVIRVGGLFAE